MFLFVVPVWQRCKTSNIKYIIHVLQHNVHHYSHQYSEYANNRQQCSTNSLFICNNIVKLCGCYCNPCSKQASSVAKRTNEYTHMNEWEKNSSSRNSIHGGKTEDSRSTGEERSGVYVVSILTSIHLRVF